MQSTKGGRIALLAAAIALLALGALLSRCSEERATQPGAQAEASQAPPKVTYPRDRRRPTAPPAAPQTPPARPVRTAGSDPIQNAMALPGGGTVFVEVNAIRHSDVVKDILRCREEEATRNLDIMREELGVDLLEDVDRLALHEDLIAVSGFFQELTLPDEVVDQGAYGDNGKLFTLPNPDEEGKQMHLARMGDGLLVLGNTEADVKAAIDRAEGRGEPAQPLPPEIVRGSEVYGRFGGDVLQQLLGDAPGANPLVKRMAEIVTDGTVRLLVDDHVALSLDLETTSEENGKDLSLALAGVLAMARQQAEAEGNTEAAALLKQARVLPGEDGSFGVDLAVPGDLILDLLGCGEDAGSPDATVDE